VGVAILIMIVVSAAGPSAAVASMPRPAAGPPWWFHLRLSLAAIVALVWLCLSASWGWRSGRRRERAG